MSDSFYNQVGDYNKAIRNIGQPAFSSYVGVSHNDVTGNGTAYTVVYDSLAPLYVGGGFDVGTGIYTIPKTGVYAFSGTLTINDIGVLHTSLICNLQLGLLQHNLLKLNPTVIAVGGSITWSWGDSVSLLTAGAQVYVILTISGSTQTCDVPAFFFSNRFEGVMLF